VPETHSLLPKKVG